LRRAAYGDVTTTGRRPDPDVTTSGFPEVDSSTLPPDPVNGEPILIRVKPAEPELE
jgi:hypothetical protein